MSSSNSKRTVPDFRMVFYYVPHKHVFCAAVFVMFRKIDFSVVIVASCVVVRRGINTPSHNDSKAGSSFRFGLSRAAMHSLCMYFYCITL